MRKQNSRETILQHRTQILNNIDRSVVESQRQHLRAQGHVPLDEARKEGFKKVGFDVFQRPGDTDAGRIWSVEEIDGEKWLVCYTDKNDQMVRTLAKAAKSVRSMQKTASEKTAAGERVITPGDLAEIRPHTAESINFKYRGHKGYVTAAMPDRSQVTFDDGSSLWVENKDLAVVRDARELGLGDTVRMFARHNIQGQVTKFSHDKQAVHFEDDHGNQFVARANEIVKWVKSAQYPSGGFAIQNIWIDPTQPEASKLLREYMKGQSQQYQTTQGEGMGMSENDTVQPGVTSPTSSQDMKIPPAIKAQPTQGELNSGTAVPAGDLFGTPINNSNMSLAASTDVDLVGFVKRGRTLNVGDMVQKKSTGQTGFIVDINFDRKLGKFYVIDFGDISPVIEYDTDIQKVKPGAQKTMPPMPQDYTRIREQGPGGLRSESRIDSRLTPIKEAATEFVNGMLEQARTTYETQYPGERVSQTLEENMIKQAIATYMARYLPDAQQQMLSADDKNALSEEVFRVVATESGIAPDITNAPTTEDFIVQETSTIDPWDLASNRMRGLEERTAAKISKALDEFTHTTKITPTAITVLRDKHAFIHQAATVMLNRGVPKDIAHLIATQLTTFDLPNVALLKYNIKKMGFNDHIKEIFKTAADALAFTTFVTPSGQKYALDLPGMETLRGGGGGYPGGVDLDPMGWEVRNPNKDQPVDNASLEQALNENLTDQAKSFEDAGPKINIELDPENKQIVIDYGEDDKAIELQPNSPEENPQIGAESSPSMPQPGGGPNSPAPGQVGAPGGNVAGQGFNDQDIPVNF